MVRLGPEIPVSCDPWRPLVTVDLLYSRTEFVQRYTTSGAAVLIIGGVIFGAATGWRMAALWLVGVALGFALHRAAYGFSAGFRALLRDQRTAHVRAQILMLAAAVVLFFPALVLGSVLGQPVRGFVFPLSAEVALGAFLFGIGMQIGGGCMSGTLYTVGGGSIRMAVTLAFAVAGATLAAFTADLWSGLPALPPVSLLTSLGLVPALALHLTIFALAWGGLALIERRRHGAIAPVWQPVDGPWSACVWPYAWAALALALLNFVTLLIAGRPWGITQAFALWGSQAVDALGLADPAFWTFWDHPTRAEALHRPFWRDTTTVMNVGVIVGAFLAAGRREQLQAVAAAYRRCISWPRRWAACCSGPAPSSPPAATSAPSSPALRPAASTAGSGSPPRCSVRGPACTCARS